MSWDVKMCFVFATALATDGTERCIATVRSDKAGKMHKIETPQNTKLYEMCFVFQLR